MTPFYLLQKFSTDSVLLSNSFNVIMSKGNHVSLKYLDNQLLRDIKRPSIIAEFNVVKTNSI